MKIIKLRETNKTLIITQALKTLRRNGLIIFPSDTVYGLLTDATNKKAVEELINFKNRPPGKPISVFAADFKMLQELVEVDKNKLLMLKQLLPGPFTVILPSKHKVCPFLESEKGTLGVRIPQYQLINQLIQKFSQPVTATSANLSNQSPHYSIDSLLNELPKSKKRLIDLIVDAGKLPRNKPSTIIDLATSQIKILRQGDIVFISSKKYISSSPSRTKKIAQFVLKKIFNGASKKPLVFIIEGELGVGKTVFVKGIGEYFGIKNIISPTFVIYYEYGNLYHFDLYQIEEKEEFNHLGIENYLKPGNILCFEWGEKAGEIFDLLKSKGKIVYVKMRYISEKMREIEINN